VAFRTHEAPAVLPIEANVHTHPVEPPPPPIRDHTGRRHLPREYVRRHVVRMAGHRIKWLVRHGTIDPDRVLARAEQRFLDRHGWPEWDGRTPHRTTKDGGIGHGQSRPSWVSAA
jgi:hypothetical protein